jgi:tRNA(Arg) A34 adenosine deaminase TadA
MDKTFMQEAIRLSIEKMEAGEGGPFGAVIVQNGKIIGRGWNHVTSSKDPTAHAEVSAIRDACTHLGTFDLSGCEIYSSCEPCPMCLSAIYWARLDKLYFAATHTDAANAGFDDEFIYQEVSKPWETRALTTEQLMPNEAREAFEQWMAKSDKTSY